MENCDSSFPTILKPSDILVTGFNFDCGSSQAQAATAILARSIKLIVARSFGNIFMRNSINNSPVTVELPNLLERLRERFPKTLTRRTGWWLRWNVVGARGCGRVEFGRWGLPPNLQDGLAGSQRSG